MRNMPPSEDCAPKESDRLGATGVHFGALPPKNTVPPKREESLVPGRKTRVNTITKLKLLHRKPFFIVTPEFVGKNQDPHLKFPSRLARLGACPRLIIVGPKGGKRPVSMWRNLG